jgi:tetratricopeptide (TPR) repeat protein
MGSLYITQDFYLQPKKGGLAEAEIGVVFAQDVPREANKVYEKALKDLAGKRTTEGILGLNEAVKIFPDYYLALHRIGKELFKIKKYQEAVPFLIKAAEVNPKSATSFYYLGYSLYNLGKDFNKSALTSLNQAYILAPSSTQVLYVLGKVERSIGKFGDAEKHLLQAKKLSKAAVPEIQKELAQLYGDDLKKYKEAADELDLYLKASKLSPEDEKKTKKIISDLRKKAT